MVTRANSRSWLRRVLDYQTESQLKFFVLYTRCSKQHFTSADGKQFCLSVADSSGFVEIMGVEEEGPALLLDQAV
jgi:hypothetical protein